MLTVLGCFTARHDLRLVVLAGVICAIAALTAIRLLRHAGTASGRARSTWLVVAAISSGSGIFATHFIAMLAFEPSIPSAYDSGLTVLSLVFAIGLTGLGLRIALSETPRASWLGGVVVGFGIAAMHYTGMAAFEVTGRLRWDPAFVFASILIGEFLSAVAVSIAVHARSLTSLFGSAGLLALAIGAHHGVGMAGVTITENPLATLSPQAMPPGWLAGAVAVASLIVFVLTATAYALSLREQRRARAEMVRMRGLANAAVEGLIVLDRCRIVTANISFSRLVGLSHEAMTGLSVTAFLDEPRTWDRLPYVIGQPVELSLRDGAGAVIEAEVILRRIDFAGKPHHALAVRDIRQRKHAERHIRYLAHHDALTGLLNRSAFNARLDRAVGAAVETGVPIAVLCLDLDRFKAVNDLFGHAAGDAMLNRVARRVTGLLGPDQILARLGGDEFAILMAGRTGPDAAERLAKSILASLAAQASGGPADAIVGVSIGIALCPQDAVERQGLMGHADTALYRAKAEGRGTYRFFEPQMGIAVRERHALERDLEQALARGEFHLVYQKQVAAAGGALLGFEALLRWTHPTRGLVPPDVFIPVAEERGTISAIGMWVLRTACREAAAWASPLRVAVNVSAVQVHDLAFAPQVHAVLVETGLPAARLELEITETALIRNFDRAVATLRQLRTLGVGIAMDDFGTGYSSLANLRAFPFDRIKIDRSFVRNVDTNAQTAAIVRAVLGLGCGLGLPVVAEGVETVAELAFLRSAGCAEVQGYLFGRPGPVDTHGIDPCAAAVADAQRQGRAA
ncbi:EAL domain-containing protein [Methylobacterium sp. E-041]|uniref:bifunctional diguanylate cyclase/phosphodiesterase n=1 Tax=Methylobacterium sp. E-041 TaxID=2836573 RepID=UPI002443CC2B|nr:EAL domain-containing protein [Methylobacterium sp. E-041]